VAQLQPPGPSNIATISLPAKIQRLSGDAATLLTSVSRTNGRPTNFSPAGRFGMTAEVQFHHSFIWHRL
jgi:hypothetical protein